jgi:hypothetical protein
MKAAYTGLRLQIARTEGDFYLREWNWGEFSTFKPVYCGRIYGHSFFSADIWPIFKIPMLPLLFSLQVETYTRRSKQGSYDMI